MPAPVIAAIIGGAASAGTGIYGAHKQGEAADKAAAVQEKSNADAIALQRQQMAQEQAQWQAQQKFAEEQFNQQQQLRGPYRAAGQAALSKLGDVLGVSFQGYGGGQGATAAGGGNSAPAATGQAAQIINNWQATHSPTEGTGGLIAALKAGGVNASPYLYGQTPSGNEISLNGGKYKVIAGENSSTPSWYVPGSEVASGASGGVQPGSLASWGINPLRDVTKTPYSQVVPLRSLYGA